MARMASTVSMPCLRGLTMPNRGVQCGQEALRASSPRYPSCGRPGRWSGPRTGHTPAPGLPIMPRISSRLVTSEIVGTACRCWVRPHRPADDRALGVRHQHLRHPLELRAVDAGGLQHGVEVDRAGAGLVVLEVRAVRRRRSRGRSRCRARGRRPPAAACPARRTTPCRRRAGSGRTRRRCAMPCPITPCTFCGSLNRISPASGSGLIATIFAPLRLRLLQHRQHAGVVGARVLPGDDDQVGHLEVFDGHRALADADRLGQRRARGLVAHVRAVRQVVGAEAAHQQLIEERRLVAGAPGRVEHRLVRARRARRGARRSTWYA